MNCQDKEKIIKHFPDGRINYIIEKEGANNLITSYEGNPTALMKLKFKDDHFLDTIYYFEKNTPEFIVIDSLSGPYFYGTYYSMYDDKRIQEQGSYRFKRNVDFKKVISSMLPIGNHYRYNENGSVLEETQVVIRNDSVYFTKREP
ncbi:hypothetical protein [Chryseobacterium sp. MFBS3-17]|uniref:hypothetical protein n=1 Tax=Chryseobacterium sp. MFBS3-17 TaxID=2886689 RepID=UPI001D0F2654|nr:hypothetical protein [Chryseobacterium sp. MFBS3-17]MCC2590028.1 hypothetical protein [Chryseobacterium sp. MFBS3-17]